MTYDDIAIEVGAAGVKDGRLARGDRPLRNTEVDAELFIVGWVERAGLIGLPVADFGRIPVRLRQ